ncbi:MAG: threonine--tRNA ligase [Candidatus Liptonbacteria bacterium RIFCSPLOWO2_01_FULL_45_15]|uniref:Threonine--tRNA ligase n=1 Tax=Candidatus Liptonbacteria bacterium RIFCSPLOWO2_01_FULL_45_15 TaxID=1798649 RepID=A0A1G2CCE7_9BACT|nr:MAG: threonine--tRNA ligase [Candidatus Liptonbacteria bacterium RIFCSPLOWO2_01_FULL_45_15]
MAKTAKDSKIDNIRHSLAHLLAAAVLKRFPKAKLGIGPVIENGFYYDFLINADERGLTQIKETDLPEIEKEMRRLIRMNLSFTGKKIMPAEAKKLFNDQQFKLDLIKEFIKETKTLTAYTIWEKGPRQSASSLRESAIFVDLCKGGHVKNTSEINIDAFKLTHVAGAYWRGDEKKPQLQRVYGLAFETKNGLDDYLKMREEAERRDHKKLGPQLKIFMFHEAAPGMPYWLPNGTLIYNELINFWREEHKKRNYHEIISPLLNKKELYITSGHYEHYWEEMFVAKTDESEEYGVKAMNCPNAMVVFGSEPRSYRDLPLRFADTDTLHRHERSGTLNGLLRVREFRQDDAHCFVSEAQIGDEYKEIFKIVERFYSVFGLSYSFRLGTRPEKFMGDKKTWDRAEKTLTKILKESGKKFAILEGDGAFYGPKVDILMKDSIGREWQMGTIQLDFQQPRNFRLEYADKDGGKKTPVAIHRVIYGSLERFIGILIEHFAGAFPLWLSPVQVAILPLSEKFTEYANDVFAKIRENNIRVEISDSGETLGKRIREAEMKKIPYVLVVGEREETSKTVSVRHYRRGQDGNTSIEKLAEKIKREIAEKVI